MGDWAYLINNYSGNQDESWAKEKILRVSKYSIPLVWTSLYASEQFLDRTTEWDIYDSLLESYDDVVRMVNKRKEMIKGLFEKPIEPYLAEFMHSLSPAKGFYILMDIGELDAQNDAGLGTELHSCIRAWNGKGDEDLEIALSLAGFQYDKQKKKAVIPEGIEETDFSYMLVGASNQEE
jgi:hypothetical protein